MSHTPASDTSEPYDQDHPDDEELLDEHLDMEYVVDPEELPKRSNRIFGREPAAILGFVEAALALAIAFGLGLSAEQTALLVALVSAVLAAVAAWATTETALAALLGLLKAALAVAVGFGLQVTPEQVAVIMTVAASAIGLYQRTQTSPA